MWIVGNSLIDLAAASDSAKADLYGRSALNRYYYAAFLEARRLVVRVNPAWAKPAHSDLPQILTGKFFKVLDSHLGQLLIGGEITDEDRLKRTSNVQTAIQELADLLTMAREVRRLADYEPETLMLAKDGELSLGGTTLRAAKGWDKRVQGLLKVIYRAYVEFAIIKH